MASPPMPAPAAAEAAPPQSPPAALVAPKLECPSPPPAPPSPVAGPYSQLPAAPPVAVPVVAVPCYIAAAGAMESPTLSGHFAMTHQAALATVTAQAQMQLQAAHPSSSEVLSSSFLQHIATTISPVPLQIIPAPGCEGSVCTPRAEQTQSSDREPQTTRSALKINHDDGYNWRKYGQKQVKSGANSRSYYKCTSADCSAKKKVEQCPDGRVTEVSYRGQHSHDPPQQTRYSRERVVRSAGALGENENLELPRIESKESDPSMSKTEHKSGNETTEQQLFCSSDCEGDAATKAEEDLGDEPDSKRRLSESTMHYSSPVLKTFREPRIVVQAASDVGRVSDGYRWRKYGQKTVKGNPNPRSYYRCTYNGCPVRKHVEVASDDATSIIISYEGKHIHELPVPKNNIDPPVSPRLPWPCATAATPGEQIHTSHSLLELKLPANMPEDVNGKTMREKSLELKGENAMESTQAEDGEGTVSERLKSPLLNENPAAVPVQNS